MHIVKLKLVIWALLGVLIFPLISVAQRTQSALPATTPALLWGDLQPGSFSVGFRVLYQRDKTRPWLKPTAATGVAPTDPGRPIRISMWYPAVPGKAPNTMRYGDYFHFDGPDTFRKLNDELERSDLESETKDLMEISPQGREILARLLATPVAASLNAPEARGPFPLVLYSGGLGSRADANVELGEFLASHGFVVATLPQLGPSENDLDLGSSPAEVTLRVRDLEFALNILRVRADIDERKLIIVGHSAGGTVALDFAMRNPQVRIVVGLDGSYGFTGGASIAKRLPDYAPSRIRASILDLRRANGVQGATLDLSVVEACQSSDRYLVTFLKMFHGDFTEFGPIGLKLSVPLPPNNDGRTRQSGYKGNQHAYRAILDFLDAKLRGRPTAMRNLYSEISQSEGAKIVHEKQPAPPRQGSEK